MSETINLAERKGMDLQLVDKDGNPVLAISLEREAGNEVLPQLNVRRFKGDGNVESVLTIFDVENI